MKFNQTVKYNLKRVLPILGIAGATLLPACREHQNEPEPKPTPVVQKHDTTLWFNYMGYDSIAPENIQRYLADTNITNIYLEPNKPIDFVNATTEYITALRELIFTPALNTDPKRVHGRGNFLFYPGVALPADSLWIVQQGWTINQPQR